jgi:hypothetical protein
MNHFKHINKITVSGNEYMNWTINWYRSDVNFITDNDDNFNEKLCNYDDNDELTMKAKFTNLSIMG